MKDILLVTLLLVSFTQAKEIYATFSRYLKFKAKLSES